VLVAGTGRDQVAGSGIEFEDRGMHSLKGVPREWRVFAARTSAQPDDMDRAVPALAERAAVDR